MKRLLLGIFTVLLGTSGVAVAGTGSLNGFKSHFLPVLVRVNAKAKVVDASPAEKLPPQIERLMRNNLDEMIIKPANDKHGRPMASQFIINLVLQTTPTADGNYDAQFTYLSTAPVPPGSWYWVHIDGHRLALASQDTHRRGLRQRIHRVNPPPAFRSNRTPAYMRQMQRPATPPPARSLPPQSKGGR